MSRPSPKALLCVLILCAGLWANAAPLQNAANTATILRVAILERANEIEIAASHQVTPHTLVLTGPDRVVIDFPGAVPGAGLRPMFVNRGDVKAVRVSLFKSNPPVTRVVLDLKAPRAYQLYPSGNTVIVKVGFPGSAASPDLVSRSGSNCPVVAGNPQFGPLAPHPPPHDSQARVSFQNGLLSVRADKATLTQVLLEVQRQTGADIAVPADAEQEQVVADLGPAPAKEVLAALLYGTHYNFILLGYDGDAGSVQRVILSPKSGELTTEPHVSSELSQAAMAPTIEPQPDPVAATPLPNILPDQNNFPQYRLRYGPGNTWKDRADQPPMPEPNLGGLTQKDSN